MCSFVSTFGDMIEVVEHTATLDDHRNMLCPLASVVALRNCQSWEPRKSRHGETPHDALRLTLVEPCPPLIGSSGKWPFDHVLDWTDQIIAAALASSFIVVERDIDAHASNVKHPD